MPDRELYPLIKDLTLPNNMIQTAKYSALTFIPINLVEQFTQLANVYFLVTIPQKLHPNVFRLSLDFRQSKKFQYQMASL